MLKSVSNEKSSRTGGINANLSHSKTTGIQFSANKNILLPLQTPASFVLNSANRFPFSSTPAVSPTHNLQLNKSKGKTSRCNTPGSGYPKENFKPPQLVGTKMNTSNLISSRDKRNVEDNPSAPISPIGRLENNQEIFLKLKRNDNTMLLAEGSLLLSSQIGYERRLDLSAPRLSSTMISETKINPKPLAKVPFPFPTVTAYDSIDRDDMVLNNLRLLKMYRYFQIEEEKLLEKRKGMHLGTGKVVKKKLTKPDDVLPSFNFTKEMFYAPNTPAFIHTFYLLFQCYDPKECENNFRDVWPVYDKKLESAFRRVTLKWLKEIIELYPQFFAHTKPEILAGLINKPTGDRFIQLTECFVQLVLFRVTERQGGEHLNLKKPILSGDSEITNRQLLVLQKRSRDLNLNTIQTRKRILNVSIEIQKRLDLMKEKQNVWLSWRATIVQRAEYLLSEVENQNHLDYNLSDRMIALDTCSTELKPLLRQIDEKLLEINYGNEIKLKMAAVDSLQLLKTLEVDYLQKFNRLWFILGMNRNQDRALDGKRLFFLKDTISDLPSLQDFYMGASTIINRILRDRYLNQPIQSPVLREFKSVDLKFQYLNLVQQKNQNREGFDADSLKHQLEIQTKYLKMKLNGINWSEFSKVYDEKLSTQLPGTSPTKEIDFFKQTGYTPGIQNFLAIQSVGDVTDGSHCSYRSSSMSQIASKNRYLEDLRRKEVSFNPNLVGTGLVLSSDISSPVTRFGSFSKKLNVSNLRMSNGLKQQQVSISQIQIQKSFNNTSTTENTNVNITQKNIEMDYERNDKNVFQNCTPKLHSRGSLINSATQARIDRMLDSLNQSSPTNSEDDDQNTIDGSESPNNRKSERFSMPSVATNTSEFNRSLLEEWTQQKGIMEMDSSFHMLESDDDS